MNIAKGGHSNHGSRNRCVRRFPDVCHQTRGRLREAMHAACMAEVDASRNVRGVRLCAVAVHGLSIRRGRRRQSPEARQLWQKPLNPSPPSVLLDIFQTSWTHTRSITTLDVMSNIHHTYHSQDSSFQLPIAVLFLWSNRRVLTSVSAARPSSTRYAFPSSHVSIQSCTCDTQTPGPYSGDVELLYIFFIQDYF
jgi:hypothetical protein